MVLASLKPYTLIRLEEKRQLVQVIEIYPSGEIGYKTNMTLSRLAQLIHEISEKISHDYFERMQPRSPGETVPQDVTGQNQTESSGAQRSEGSVTSEAADDEYLGSDGGRVNTETSRVSTSTTLTGEMMRNLDAFRSSRR
jgi:hypothetical protein